MKKFLLLIIALATVTVVLSPGLVFAQATQNKLPKYEGGVDQSIRDYLCTPSEPADGRDLERCVNRLYRFGISFGAIALVFFVVIAGYIYITGGEQGKGKAKGMLANAFTGMAILVGSYALLYFINPNLVTFRPIQPPIFDAPDIATCEELGFGRDCVGVVSPEEYSDSSETNSGTNRYASCSGGVVSISGVPRADKATQICAELLGKLKTALSQYSSQSPGMKFIITSTIRNSRTQSRCHKSGSDVTGNCADIALRNSSGGKVLGNNEEWGKLCRVLLGLGLELANETGSSHSGCRAPKTFDYTNGAHFHVFVPG